MSGIGQHVNPSAARNPEKNEDAENRSLIAKVVGGGAVAGVANRLFEEYRKRHPKAPKEKAPSRLKQRAEAHKAEVTKLKHRPLMKKAASHEMGGVPHPPGVKEAAAEARKDPKKFEKKVQAQRQAKRAGKARVRPGKMLGATGALLDAGGTIEAATRISKEGGTVADRFSKFVEELHGLPAGTSGRGTTAKERAEKRRPFYDPVRRIGGT